MSFFYFSSKPSHDVRGDTLIELKKFIGQNIQGGKMYKISDFSNKTGFSARMLRHLEEMELLIPDRNTKNYRSYSDSHIPTAIKIKSFQKMGFSLREIKSILLMDLTKLEDNLAKLFEKKKGESKNIESQIRKISLVQNAIKNGSTDFSFIDELDEIDSDDRAQIVLGHLDLATRVVKGRSPRLEIIAEEMFERLNQDNLHYDFDSVDLYKFSEWLKPRPKTYYAIFEVEELVCYFMVAIKEDEILENLEMLNIQGDKDIESQIPEAMKNYATHLMNNYKEAWQTIFMPLTISFVGVTNDKEKLELLYSPNEVLLDMGIKCDHAGGTMKLTLGFPINTLKAVDNATPY